MSDANMLGRDAYLRGDDLSMNPYDESDAQHDEWDDGYRQKRDNPHRRSDIDNEA